MKHMTRKEIFMAALAKGVKAPIKPLTREEQLLAAHAEREASGGGGASNVMHVFIKPEFDEENLVFRGCNKTYQEIAEVYETTPIVWHYFDKSNKNTYVATYVQWTDYGDGQGSFNIGFEFDSRVILHENNTLELYMAD